MEIITKINWVDVIVVILLIRTSYVAFQDGLSHEIFPFLGSLSSLVISLYYFRKLATLMVHATGGLMPIGIADFMAFVVIYAAVIILFKLIRAIFGKMVKVTWHPLIEKAGGLIVGMGKACIITSAVLIMLELIPLSYIKWSVRDRSMTGPYFLNIASNVYTAASYFVPAAQEAAKGRLEK